MGKEVSNEQLFEFMTKMYNELTGRIDNMQDGLTGRIDNVQDELTGRIDNVQGGLAGRIDSMYSEMQEGFKEVKAEIEETKNKVIIIEQEHGKKLNALFDGYKQNSDKLDRIQAEVSKYEEIILRKIK